MADRGNGGRQQDGGGYQLLVGDSRTASNLFGFGGNELANVPKSKFMFYVKFYRPYGDGNTDWARGVGFVLKSIDRPKVSFDHQILNQYNRKRIVQTGSEFESVVMKFHDTVGEDVQRMFEEYYRFYYADQATLSTSVPLYDITTPEWQSPGEWGFKLPEASPGNSYGYFFSHISVFQVYNKLYSRFDLINPKIHQYNPDDLDYASGQVSNEIQMNINFEGIVYHKPEVLTPELIQDMGLDMAAYFDVTNAPLPITTNPSAGYEDPTVPKKTDPFKQSGNILKRQLKRAIAGENVSLKTIGTDALNSFDKNRGLATAKLGTNAIGDLINGKDKGSLGAVRKLPLYGKPGKLF